MGARRNHYYFIDRYPTGLDATVFKSGSGSVQTMSWTNDTAYPVLIRGYKIKNGSKGYVRFDLYSVPTGRKVVIGNPTIKNIRPGTDTVQYTRIAGARAPASASSSRSTARTSGGRSPSTRTARSFTRRRTTRTTRGSPASRSSARRYGHATGPLRAGGISRPSVSRSLTADAQVGQYQRASSARSASVVAQRLAVLVAAAPQSARSRSADARSRPSPVSEYSIRGGRVE